MIYGSQFHLMIHWNTSLEMCSTQNLNSRKGVRIWSDIGHCKLDNSACYLDVPFTMRSGKKYLTAFNSKSSSCLQGLLKFLQFMYYQHLSRWHFWYLGVFPSEKLLLPFKNSRHKLYHESYGYRYKQQIDPYQLH